MKLTYQNGVFVAVTAGKHEAPAAKAAGLWWHGVPCRPGCKGPRSS